MAYIDIRLTFEDITDDLVDEDEDDPNRYYHLDEAYLKSTDIPLEYRRIIVEALGQSDRWHVDAACEILEAMEEQTMEAQNGYIL